MTKSQALAEARRRWGSRAYAKEQPYITPSFYVGVPSGRRIVNLQFPSPCGAGDTWEAAFADAERREKGKGT